MNRTNLADRFWSNVENASGADCWQWLGAIHNRGYGWVAIKRKGRLTQICAHRLAWELRRGPIPEGLCVLHKCDNRGCCNPAHLFLGARADNNADMVAKERDRHPQGEEHWKTQLTWIEVCLIRLGGVVGMTQDFLARRFHVSQTTVRFILSGRTWKEPPETEEYIAAMFADASV